MLQVTKLAQVLPKELDLLHSIRGPCTKSTLSQLMQIKYPHLIATLIQLVRLILTPTASISWCQCRALRAGLCNSVTALNEVIVSFTVLSRPR